MAYGIDSEQWQDMSRLLAWAAHINGGALELTDEQMRELQEHYGEPAPMFVAREDGGVFAAVFTLEEFVERGWPYLQRVLHCSEELARAQAEAMASSLRVSRVKLMEQRSSGEGEATGERNDGWAALDAMLRRQMGEEQP